ncbi:Fumarylacetoacetate hydrolase family protein [hydrothermal vent metagenome]|uniref:Fumarylacetoacetate hydrolase family protein n=1 Tax=hydrothermal vent metagenome TaxID=652676 RepID=A0A161KF44_9ZZZZ
MRPAPGEGLTESAVAPFLKADRVMPLPHVTPATLAIIGTTDRFPVRRIFCVGQNYADHAREMGSDPDRQKPFFFTKPADAVVDSGSVLPFPGRTADLHHEVELVVALSGGGTDIPVADAAGLIFGYAAGLDLTRRDLQAEAKKAGRPWDMAKGFDRSAPVGPLTPCAPPASGAISLTINGTQRQSGTLDQMIWSTPEIIAELSTYVDLRPGDLIFTGTPAGVGPILRGDRLEAMVEGAVPLLVAFAG